MGLAEKTEEATNLGLGLEKPKKATPKETGSDGGGRKAQSMWYKLHPGHYDTRQSNGRDSTIVVVIRKDHHDDTCSV